MAEDKNLESLLNQLEYLTDQLRGKDKTIARLGKEVDWYKEQLKRNQLFYTTLRQTIPDLPPDFTGDIAPIGQKLCEVVEDSYSDYKTKANTYRFLIERLNKDFEKVKKKTVPNLTMAFVDIDHFKDINSKYGHLVADNVLVHLVKIAKLCYASGSIIAKFGGEEFIIVAPQDKKSTLAETENFRNVFKTTSLSVEGVKEPITISAGLCEYDSSMAEPRDFIHTSNQAMLKAKSLGRDCIVTYEGPEKGYVQVQGSQVTSKQ